LRFDLSARDRDAPKDDPSCWDVSLRGWPAGQYSPGPTRASLSAPDEVAGQPRVRPHRMGDARRRRRRCRTGTRARDGEPLTGWPSCAVEAGRLVGCRSGAGHRSRHRVLRSRIHQPCRGVSPGMGMGANREQGDRRPVCDEGGPRGWPLEGVIRFTYSGASPERSSGLPISHSEQEAMLANRERYLNGCDEPTRAYPTSSRGPPGGGRRSSSRRGVLRGPAAQEPTVRYPAPGV